MNAGPAIVVVDANLALKWVLNEDLSAEARDLLAEWEASGVAVLVPSWFACEVANVFFQYVRRGALSVADAQAGVEAVLSAVQLQAEEPLDAIEAVLLADRAQQRASYDAQYAAVAARLGCALWTADDLFARAIATLVSNVHSLSERT